MAGLFDARDIVGSEGRNGFLVNNVHVRGGVLLTGTGRWLWSAADPGKDLTMESLAALRVLRPRPELLIIGCGRRGAFIPPALRKALRDEGIVVDAMDTPNACATFNILVQEDRPVAAALLPLEPAMPYGYHQSLDDDLNEME